MIRRDEYQQIFLRTALINLEGERATIGVESIQQKLHIEAKYIGNIRIALESIVGQQIEIYIIIIPAGITFG
jgi:hypothetical protein